MKPRTDDVTAHLHSPANTDVRTARVLVAGQFALIGILVVLPGRHDGPVPVALTAACAVATVVGLAVMVISTTALGRGLTATPLPNAHAQLRTGGLYRFVRHPIYSGLLLTMASITVAFGSGSRLLTLVVLLLLLTLKARWEETRLAQRFGGYASYAARTPRFLPVRLRRQSSVRLASKSVGGGPP
ncbi:MAG: isoprenylcysteine carboxylmethyltransferase family protein [Actinomycetota bacterium]